jgi:hypothetical protein
MSAVGLRRCARIVALMALFALGVAVTLTVARVARAEERDATFVLIVGTNASIDRELRPLRYADDDAARYLELFRALGAQTTILTRTDEATQKLHPQATAEARAPVRAELDAAVLRVRADVARARARGVKTSFYFVYAGHGNVKDGRGYITLEDARLDGRDLDAIVERVAATHAHVIVDACYSSFLALGRGPGGERRSARGFTGIGGLAARESTGLLLSTSSARESHEWEAVQAGVFSHEVRSGLYGAADANGDGRVSYAEIAAFVQRANAGLVNEKYRPDVFARAPHDEDTLLDLRDGLKRRLEIDGARHGHYILEDARGVRIAEFHNAKGHDVKLLRPLANGNVYVRRVADDLEFIVGAAEPVVLLASLDASPLHAQARGGAADESFRAIFSSPFGAEDVAAYVPRPIPTYEEPKTPWQKPAGYTALAVSGAAAVGAVTCLVAAQAVRAGAADADPQASLARRNDDIRALNTAALALGGVSLAGAAVGVSFLVVPAQSARGGAGTSAFATVHASF